MGLIERAWRGGRSDWRLHLLSIFSVAVAFVCLAAAVLVVVNVHGLRERWASSGRASVYLRADASSDDVASIEKALLATDGVSNARYVSSEDARRELRGEDDLLAELPKEAFPASIEVELSHPEAAVRLGKLSTQLEALPAVESVETYGEWTERLGALLTGGVTAALLLALVVFGAVVSVVSSTLRLTLQRRRIEVEVLKLVGATDDYVRSPFLLEGAAQGAIGAVVAIGLLGVLYGIVIGHFEGPLAGLLGVEPVFLPWSAALAMVAVGATLGALAAWGSLRKLLVV